MIRFTTSRHTGLTRGRFLAVAAIGDGIDLAIDVGHTWLGPATLRAIKELAPSRPPVSEAPCPPEHVDTLVPFVRSTPSPIATGERQVTPWGFREAIEQ